MGSLVSLHLRLSVCQNCIVCMRQKRPLLQQTKLLLLSHPDLCWSAGCTFIHTVFIAVIVAARALIPELSFLRLTMATHLRLTMSTHASGCDFILLTASGLVWFCRKLCLHWLLNVPSHTPRQCMALKDCGHDFTWCSVQLSAVFWDVQEQERCSRCCQVRDAGQGAAS